MKCPFCRASENDVYNSRSTKFGNVIWRRRRCRSCHEAFTTYESADLGFIKVAHDHQKREETFSRARLYASISGAFSPSHKNRSVVDAITDTVEAKLLDTASRTLNAAEISRVVLATLKAYDQAAFLRYLADHANLSTSTSLKIQLKEY